MSISDKQKKKKRNGKYSTLKQALEPRMLFDASLVPPPTDHAVTGTNSANDGTSSPTAADVADVQPAHPGQPADQAKNTDPTTTRTTEQTAAIEAQSIKTV